jgi:flagellar biosynthesis protein FlhF
MRLKSFFADSIEEAIRLARRELGPDAMLVNSKRTGAEARHLGAYEVAVCGEENMGSDSAPRRQEQASPPQAFPPMDKLSSEVSELKRQMERMARTLARSGGGMAALEADPGLARAFAALSEAELDIDLAYEIAGRLPSPVSPQALRTELGRLVNVDCELGCAGAPSRIVALVGPPGSGKTSTLVKLAVEYGASARAPTEILTMDTYRIAAADELRSYASILGIGCQVLETPAALAQALEEHRRRHLILIDTPGLSRNEMDSNEDLARFLATYPGIDTHLVLPASMRTVDMRRIADQYSIFHPRKLLFTRLDETETFGPILGQSIRMGKPVSFLSRGQRIPEDLEAPTVDQILNLILKPEPAPAPAFGVAAA